MDRVVGQSYRAFMLRLRRSEGVPPKWPVTLEEVANGQKYALGSLDETVAWLREAIGEPVQGSETRYRSEVRHEATTGGKTGEGGDDGPRATGDLYDG
jgi:hypothetical protein